MDLEKVLIAFILITGWPYLIVMTILIVVRGRGFYRKLKGTVIGKLILPTVFGWLFGLYALGIVSTAYMFCLPWYATVIPAFATFLVAINIVYFAMKRWEREATEIQAFYENLEKLVAQRTKELEEAHQEALKHEKEIQKLKDQFVFIAAHELRTPVTAIRWGIENALEEGKSKLDKDTVEQLQSIQNSNQRLITLVDDLLNVARIEAGTIKIDPKNVDLDKMIIETLKEMDSIFSVKKVETHYEPKGPVMVYADPDRLKQVLINLLSNATKYNKEDGKIHVSVQTEKGFARIAVKDTGIGVKKEDMKTLFTKFGRVENRDTEEIEGTGLGLYLCKEIITKMGGVIYAESTYGNGSTFIFTVPLEKESTNDANEKLNS